MWIFYDGGFISAVEARDHDKLVVRARDFRSLEPLAEFCGMKPQRDIIIGGGTDYPYRLVVRRADFASWAHDVAMSVDYTNFKDRVSGPRGRGKSWSHPLMQVWTAMLEVTPERARRRQNRFWERLWDRRESEPALDELPEDHIYASWMYDEPERDLNSASLHSLTDDEWARLLDEEERT